jgi:zinc transporter
MSSDIQQQPDSDNGLICAYILDGKGTGRKLGWADHLEAPDHGALWVHLDFAHPNARAWVKGKSGLDPNVVEALLSDESRPRSFEYDTGILTVLRGVNTNPGEEPEDMVSIRVWIEPNLIISTRRRRLMSIIDIREAVEAGRGPTSPGAFLVFLADRLGDRIGHTVEGLDDALDEMEESHSSGEIFSARAVLSETRRKTARIRRYLAPQRDALDRLSRSRLPLLPPDEIAMLQEQTNRMAHYIEELDLARERALVAQEEALSNLAAEQNARMLVLSIVAAVFLPLAFFTGLMGMNVAGLPGLEDDRAFWIVVALMFATAGGILGFFKFKDWL